MAIQFLEIFRPRDGDWNKLLGAVLAVSGFAWTAWTFVFKEILTPAAAPVNISLGLEVKRLGPNSDPQGDIPVMLTASAKNSSGKTLKINKSFWVAHAISLDRNSVNTETQIIRDINQQIAGHYDSTTLDGPVSWHQKGGASWNVVAFGPLFDANDIKPNEEIQAQRLILVRPSVSTAEPSRKFDVLRVTVNIPSYAPNSALAEDGLIRVVGGISINPNSVAVGFCQAKRTWQDHNLRWWFDKFVLPEATLRRGFQEPAARYCPAIMTEAERRRHGAQVFTSVYEIPLQIAGRPGQS